MKTGIKYLHIFNLTFFLFSICLPDRLPAQTDTLKYPDQFLFPEFSVGIARTKNGEKTVLNLNYNIVTEKMVFMQNKQIYDITSQSIIDTVYIEGRKFIPHGKVFYEMAVNGEAAFFIQHKGTIEQPGRPAAYGGTSQVSSSTYINNLKLGNDVYRMDHKREVIIKPASLLWIRIDYNYYAVTGKKSLLKIFADKKSEVKSFMNKSKFDFEDPEQVKNLVIHYNDLF
jgi:hypothetical protein